MGRIWKLLNTPIPRTKPLQNVCCKCGHELEGLAPHPPFPSARGLSCPKCSKPVNLRDHWRTDGRYHLLRLIDRSWLIAILAATMIFVVGPLRPRSRFQAIDLLSTLIAALPVCVLILIGPVVMCLLASRGTVNPDHEKKRALATYIPFAIVYVLYMLVGNWVFRKLGS